MSEIHDTTVQPFAATGIAPSLALWGGAWTISTDGLNPGDYLLTAPGEMAEVVTIAQDYHGARSYTCTCTVERFDCPVSDSGDGCLHIGLVGLFLQVPVAVLAGDLGRAVRVLRGLIRKQVDAPTATRDALITRQADRAAVLQAWYIARRNARVAVIPRRITETQEAADAASTPAGWFLPKLQHASPALAAAVVEMWGGAPVVLAEVA